MHVDPTTTWIDDRNFHTSLSCLSSFASREIIQEETTFLQELLLRAHSCEGNSCWCLHDLPARLILRFGPLFYPTISFSPYSLTSSITPFTASLSSPHTLP